jgi:hypothetical protein
MVWLTLAAAVDAPISDVTVFSDRARVVRTVALATAGTQSIELPVLPQTADPRSIRVEATGAEVKRVDLTRLEDDALPTDEARKLLASLQQLDDELAKTRGEANALNAQSSSLNRIAPAVPPAEPLKPSPRLNATGWTTAMTFVAESLSKLQARQLELSAKEQALSKKRSELAQKAQLLGATQKRFGWKVIAQLAGGAPTVKLTYFVDRARWYPLYDLGLNSDTGKVTVAFCGLVSQESGEDWADAALTLSTAVPATESTLPKLLTWKIGEKERFIPTPTPMADTPRAAPSAPPLPAAGREQDLLRTRLQQMGGSPPAPAPPPGLAQFDFDGLEVRGQTAEREEAKRPQPKRRPQRGEDFEFDRADRAPPPTVSTLSAPEATRSTAPEPTFGFSLAPPPGYRPPSFGADLPAAAAGGSELSYLSLQKETVQTGKGARKVALFTEAWPVTVERKIFPALFPEAFLVAELKNPSSQPLPAGNANLYVGDDPAGTARLKLVSPGEAFTLPLGIDRALKPVRNVKVVQSERGIVSKDEISQYTVSIELANPHRSPVSVRLLDQIPITSQKDVEVTLLESKPLAAADKRTGTLEWRLSVPAAQKAVVSFTYSVKRPKGWKLYQEEQP